jgi:hypothetical protein
VRARRERARDGPADERPRTERGVLVQPPARRWAAPDDAEAQVGARGGERVESIEHLAEPALGQLVDAVHLDLHVAAGEPPVERVHDRGGITAAGREGVFVA